jgi:hypothetical protein
MVQTLVDSCTLNEENITGVLHDTDDTAVSRWVSAQETRVYFRNTPTLRTENNLFFDLNDGLSEPLGTGRGSAKEKKS